MGALEIGLWIASIAATAGITRHYSRKQIRRRLVAYLDIYSSPFEGLEGTVREALALRYRGSPVQSLRHIEFVVVNEGDLAIKEWEKPLSMNFEAGVSIVDADVVAQSSGVEAKVLGSTSDAGILTLSFPFGLLNPGDWFRVKLLLDAVEDPKPSDWTLTIRGENVAPRVEMKPARLDDSAFRKWLSDLFVTFTMVGAAVVMGVLYGVGRLVGYDPTVDPQTTLDQIIVWVALVVAIVIGGWFATQIGGDAENEGWLPEGARKGDR